MPREGTIVDRRKSTTPYAPYYTHINPGVVLHDQGTRMAMWELHGIPHELSPADQRNIHSALLNKLWRDIQDDNVTVGVHLRRWPAAHNRKPRRFRMPFCESLYNAHYNAAIKDRLYDNQWYLSLMTSPRGIPLGSKRFQRWSGNLAYQFTYKKDRRYADTSQLEGLALQLESSLRQYSMRRLGYRYNQTRYHRYAFSEPGEACKKILGIDGAVPITTGRLGDDIVTDSDQPVFENRIFRILPPGCDDKSDDAEGVIWGSLFAINNYMESTGPDLFDAILQVPFPIVVSQYFSFKSTPDAVGQLRRTFNQITANKEAGGKKAKRQLRRATEQAQAREIGRGEHDCIVAIYGPTYSRMMQNCATGRSELVKTGAQLVELTGANLEEYFGQLPGNFRYVSHPGDLSTEDFSHFANFGAYPRGHENDLWGDDLVELPTTANTGYKVVPHVGDVGMIAIFGKTGSGKTVLVCFLIAMLDQYLADTNGIIVIYDKDDGCRIFVELGLRGNYLSIVYGQPTGLHPLRGFKENTPYARACLIRLFKTMILMDGLGPIPAPDHEWIERGVDAMLRLPPHERSIARLRLFLGYYNAGGAGPRLQPWCKGNALGWVFDESPEDLLDYNVPAVGFNLGALLDDPLLEPVSQYIRDRTEPIFDGRRGVEVNDECGKYVRRERMAQDIRDRWQGRRKANVIEILAAQEPEEFEVNEIARGIINQATSLAFFPTPGANRLVYCGDDRGNGGMGCSQGEYEAINERMDIAKREFLWKQRGINTESAICRLDLSGVDPWYLHVLSGTTARINYWTEMKTTVPNPMAEFAEHSKEVVA